MPVDCADAQLVVSVTSAEDPTHAMPYTLRPDSSVPGRCYVRSIVEPSATAASSMAEDIVVAVTLRGRGVHVTGSPVTLRAVRSLCALMGYHTRAATGTMP